MKLTKEKIKYDNILYMIGLFLMFVSTVCFYTAEHMSVFLTLSTVGILLIFAKSFFQNGIKNACIDGCVLYLSLFYFLFISYDIMFLRSGKSGWENYLYYYVECLAMYVALVNIFNSKNWIKELTATAAVTTTVCLAFLLYNELDSILAGGVRIGDSASGNVNSVAMALGLFSMLLTFYFCVSKDKKMFILLALTAFVMLITGSKKGLYIIAMDLFLAFYYSKKRIRTFLIVAVLAVVFLYLIFEVDYLYNIIGERTYNMFYQLFIAENSGARDVSSTAKRMSMIIDGFNIFFDHPIFGGGLWYFAKQSIWGVNFAYSHCNYTELLCNFGIVGTLIYYVPYFTNLGFLIGLRRADREKTTLCIMLILMSLFMGWMSVLFDGSIVSFMPIVASYAALKSIRAERTVTANEKDHTSIVRSF